MEIPAAADIKQHGRQLEIPEIRVWCHSLPSEKSGDDYFYTFPSFKDALAFIRKHKEEAEPVPLIAFRGYEINLFEGVKHLRKGYWDAKKKRR